MSNICGAEKDVIIRSCRRYEENFQALEISSYDLSRLPLIDGLKVYSTVAWKAVDSTRQTCRFQTELTVE